MRVTFWGVRGSLASPGPETVRYGGNTACVEVRDSAGTLVILDAGTGIRRLGDALDGTHSIHLLLSHLHLDHIQGLGFFAPLFRRGVEIDIWGPPSLRADLAMRLNRYLSPPLFPVALREVQSRVRLHDAMSRPVGIGELEVVAERVVHPGPTVGYRLSEMGRSLVYLPDHEPALGVRRFPEAPAWTSGHALASGANMLIHDAQYTASERRARIGWGHSSLDEAVAFASAVGAQRLVPFHHDPNHSDDDLDSWFRVASAPGVELVAATEGTALEV